MMSLPDSVMHDSEALALLCQYLDWGVDCALVEEGLSRFGEVSPLRLAPKPSAIARIEPPASPVTREVSDDDQRFARASSLEELAAIVRAVSDFPLARTATHPVLPIHVPGASLMIIGETPNADEDRSGIPLAGETSELLEQILGSIGLSVAAQSRMAALPWRPPGGRDASSLEMRYGRPALERAIALIRPQRLVLLGGTAVRMLLDETTSPARTRGKWTDVRIASLGTVPALGLRHPLQIRTSAAARREMWKDLLLLAGTLDLPVSSV